MDIEQEARLQGWVSKEEFKGDGSKWVDADAYVERGSHIMPILQNNNKRLLSELESVKSVVETLKATVDSQNQSMEELKVFHQESTAAQVEKARRELLADLKLAKSEGDVEQEVKITSDLSRFDAAQVATQSAPEVKVTKSQEPPLSHETITWMNKNPWYGVDMERTGLMDGVAKRLRKENSPLTGTAFLEAAGEIVAERWGDKEVSSSSKVESGSYSSNSGRTSGSYATLPSEAKEICEKQATRFVGADKVYKTKKEWQEFFASEYHKGK